MSDIDKFIALKNIAEELDESILQDIGTKLKEWFDEDEFDGDDEDDEYEPDL